MSSDLYVHRHLKLSSAQHDNLVALGYHLITRSSLLRRFEKLVFSDDENERAPLPPDRVVEGRRMPAMMPLAFGPLAGVPALEGETWTQYGERAFCMPLDSLLAAWLQHANWRLIDASPIGAGLRIAYALDYGVPHDWEQISRGQTSSDYPTNGFIWERLDLAAWNVAEGKDEWRLEWPMLKRVTRYRD